VKNYLQAVVNKIIWLSVISRCIIRSSAWQCLYVSDGSKQPGVFWRGLDSNRWWTDVTWSSSDATTHSEHRVDSVRPRRIR